MSRFYRNLSIKLGLPIAATKAVWADFGRNVLPNAPAVGGAFGYEMYDLEHTFKVAVVPVEEKEEAKTVQTLGALLRQALERGIGQTKTPTLDKLENTSEPKRAPLDWNKSTPFDPFKGYVVRSDSGGPTSNTPSPLTLSTDLEPASHQVRVAFGSAELVRR
jgi:hypothetical protein